MPISALFDQTWVLMGLVFGRFCISAFLALTVGSVAFAQVNVPAGGSMDVPAGATLSLGCSALSVQGTLNVNSGQVSGTGDVNIASTGTVNGGQGTMSISGNWSNSGAFVPGTGTVIFTDGCAVGPLQITGATVFNNLTLTSSNGRTFVIPVGANITVNGTLTLLGSAGQPIQLVSSTGQTAVISLGPSAHVVQNFVNVSGNVQIGAISVAQPIPTLSEYGLIVLSLLLAGTAFRHGRVSPFVATRKNQHH